jgi:hypothetical protein
MPENIHGRLARLKAIEREYHAVRYAADGLLQKAKADPTVLRRTIVFRDLRNACEQLEGTYFIRLFAEFEKCLRSYWRVCIRDTAPPAEVLVDRAGAKCRIPSDRISNVHKSRAWRNALVHEQEEEVHEVTIQTAKGDLCHYLSFLPLEW